MKFIQPLLAFLIYYFRLYYAVIQLFCVYFSFLVIHLEHYWDQVSSAICKRISMREDIIRISCC